MVKDSPLLFSLKLALIISYQCQPKLVSPLFQPLPVFSNNQFRVNLSKHVLLKFVQSHLKVHFKSSKLSWFLCLAFSNGFHHAVSLVINVTENGWSSVGNFLGWPHASDQALDKKKQKLNSSEKVIELTRPPAYTWFYNTCFCCLAARAKSSFWSLSESLMSSATLAASAADSISNWEEKDT